MKPELIPLKQEEARARAQMFHDLLTNPIIELVGGFVLIELLQRIPEERPIIGDWQGNLMEGVIGGIITVQQLAPSLPYLSQASADILKLAGMAAVIAPK